MKLLYFMLLSIFGAEYGCSRSCKEHGHTQPTYTGTKCTSGEIIALKIVLSKSAKSTVKTTLCNWPKEVYLKSICSPSKLFDLGDFNVTVVRVNCVDLRRVQTCSFQLSDDDQPIFVFIPFWNCSEEQLTVGVATCLHSVSQPFTDDFCPILEFEFICSETVKCLMTVELDGLGSDTASCEFYDVKENDFTDSKNSSYDLFAIHLGNASEIDHLHPRILSFINYIANRTEKSFSFHHGELKVVDSHNTSVCNQVDNESYIKCTPVNHIMNISGVKNVFRLQGQNNSWLIFQMDKKNIVQNCESDQMNAFIPDMDVIRLTEHQKKESFALYTCVRREKVFIMNLELDGPTCEYMNFKVKVVKMDKMKSTADGCVRISASKIYKEIANTTGIYFVNLSTGLEFVQGPNASFCNWEGSQCYVECTSVNPTTNITCVKNIMPLVQCDTSSDQNDIQLVFKLNEKYSMCNVTQCASDNMNSLMDSMDLVRLKNLQKICNISIPPTIYIRAEKNVIYQHIKLSFNGANTTYDFEDFKMTVFKINTNVTDTHVLVPAPKLSDDDPPIDVFFPISQFTNSSSTEIRVGVVTFYSTQRFTDNSGTMLISKVIRVETVGQEGNNLQDPLFIYFPVNSSKSISEKYILSCQFYNEKVHMWEDTGSFTNLEKFNSNNTVNCSFYYMTPFAVLLILKAQTQTNLSCVNNRVNSGENFFIYNNTGLQIAENFSTVVCRWNGSPCYVGCSTINHVIDMMDVINIYIVEKPSNDTKNKTFVINISEPVITCNVTMCESNLISTLVEYFSSNHNWHHIKQINNMCSELFASNPSMKKLSIIEDKKNIDTLINLPFNGTTKNYAQEDLSMTVVKMNMMINTDHGRVAIAAPKMPGDDDGPITVFVPTEPFLNVSEEQCKIGVVTYRSSLKFISNSSIVFKSNVIRVEVFKRELKDLSNWLVINFTVNSKNIMDENQTMLCQFYNEKEHRWESKGSVTNLENFYSNNIVTCSYDHMTPFAVLLANTTNIDPKQWKILSCLTYIGCSLSSFFSAVTIFLYAFMKSSNKDKSLRIHMSLNTAVFLLNTSFLFTEWGAKYDTVCVIIAVIIQYSLLSCFSWMIIEAVHLYLTLIKVYNISIRHYMFKLSLFGWGVPAVLVGGSLCVFNSTPFYGQNKLNLSDTNSSADFCWITNTHFLYGMNISFLSLTFLFNTSVLVAVIYQIIKLRRINIKKRKLPSCKDISTVLGLTFLLGLTWGLIFFTSGDINYPILYLFCICNSLQGLFLFLWICSAINRRSRLVSESSSVRSKVTANIYESSLDN